MFTCTVRKALDSSGTCRYLQRLLSFALNTIHVTFYKVFIEKSSHCDFELKNKITNIQNKIYLPLLKEESSTGFPLVTKISGAFSVCNLDFPTSQSNTIATHVNL